MFILTYTRPDGTHRVVTGDADGPFARSYDAALAILTVFTDEGVQIKITEAKRAAKYVYTAPIGTPVTHEATRYTFRIDPVH